MVVGLNYVLRLYVRRLDGGRLSIRCDEVLSRKTLSLDLYNEVKKF